MTTTSDQTIESHKIDQPRTPGHATPDPQQSATAFDVEKHRRRIAKLIARKSFCVLATTSPVGHSHSTGVVYVVVNGALWIHCERTSRKARSVVANSNVGVCIPFRRLPAGPPYTIHFQARASIVEMDAPEVRRLLNAGKLKKIAGHGALDMPSGCFIKIEPKGVVHSYGPGIRAIDLISDPLNTGARTVRFTDGIASAH